MSSHLAFAQVETEDGTIAGKRYAGFLCRLALCWVPMAPPCSTSAIRKAATAVVTVILTLTPLAHGRTAMPVFTLPQSCGELLSDIGPFLGFLDAVANGLANSDRTLSRRLLRLLALRNEALRNNERLRSDNAIDGTLRRALCFYREQREPLRPVAFDDDGFIRFLRESIGDLEKKVEGAIFDVELESARRRQLESRLAKNRAAAERLEAEADRAARTSYNRILDQARKKAK